MPPSRGLLILLFTSITITITITTVLADLPIHCLNAQVAGQWEFRLTKPQVVHPTFDSAGVSAGSGYDKDISCGYDSPDKSSLHFASNSFELQVDRIFKVTLKTPNIVTDSEGNNGTYTMVYDEAYEVFLNGYSYFAFMRYRPKPSTESLNGIEVGDYISECGHTLIGWYRSIDNKYWGCWQGRQTYRSIPEAWPQHGRKGKCKKYEKKPDDLALLQVDGLLKEKSSTMLDTDQLSLGRARELHKHRASKIVRPKNAHIPTPHLKRRSTHDSLRDADGCDDIDTIFDHQEAVVSTTEFSGDTMFFQPDPVFVETHNAQKDKLWTATIHQQFVGMKMSELMAMHGMQRFDKSTHINHDDERVGPFAPKPQHPPPIKDDRPDEEKYAGLPDNFSWLNHDGMNWDVPVRNQGSCGSCYAMASTTAFEARIRVASNMKYKPRLSTQAVLSCSFYNQACDGGYPYLVGKHGAEFGFVDEECYAYTARDGKCSQQCPTGKRWYFKNYRYIGGYYGGCSEVAMMHEIIKNGPIMIAFEAPHTLTYYHGGIFTGPDPKTEPSYDNDINPWQHTNHAVVGVGWGIDEKSGTKYWIIKNTWGEHWGENGFFRIRRGTNECGIESMATTADPILP